VLNRIKVGQWSQIYFSN